MTGGPITPEPQNALPEPANSGDPIVAPPKAEPPRTGTGRALPLSRRNRLAAWLARAIFGSGQILWLVPVLSRALLGIAAVLALSLLAAGLGLALPMLTKLVIDRGIMARDMGSLVHYGALSFALGLASVGLAIVNGMVHLRASARMLADLRQRAFDAALRRDPARGDLPLGEAMARLDGDSGEIQRFAFDTVLVAIGAVFRLAGGVALMAWLDWRLVLLPVLLTPVELIFLTLARPRTQSLAEEVRDQRGALSSTLAETLSLRQTLAALGAIPARSGDFAELQQGQIAGLMRQRIWAETVGAVSQILGAVVRAGVLLVGGWLVVRGDWPMGTLIAYLAYAAMMQGPLRNLLGLYHAQARSKVAVARLDAVFAESRPQDDRAPPPEPAAIQLNALRAEGARHHPVTARLAAGSRILLDGPSGIGKTRLIAALTRDAPRGLGAAAIEDAAGRLHDIDDFAPEGLRARILHLPQRPGIMRASLARNLRLAAPEAGDAALWQALEQADLAVWVRSRDGLETALAETGADLSGGMRQRISLARAFLAQSPVMVFDESFSEIDETASRRILAALLAAFPQRLLVFIAHNGPVRALDFDQRITLSSVAPLRLSSRGETPNQRENAREKAVWSE